MLNLEVHASLILPVPDTFLAFLIHSVLYNWIKGHISQQIPISNMNFWVVGHISKLVRQTGPFAGCPTRCTSKESFPGKTGQQPKLASDVEIPPRHTQVLPSPLYFGEITDLVSIFKIITDLVSIFKIITDLVSNGQPVTTVVPTT
jgi:hypothetical protein